MQFSRIATILLAALTGSHTVSAFPCAHETSDASSTAVANAKGTRPAPMPFLTPGHQKLEDQDEDDFGFGDEDYEEARARKQKHTWGSPPPPLMRIFAERRTARY